MIMKAKDYSPDWIINADADEFWISKTGDLKDEIRNFSGNKIYVPSYYMRCRNESCFWENNEKITRLFSRCFRAYLVFRNKLCRHSQVTMGIPKVMHRLEDYKMIHRGNHWVAMDAPSEGRRSDTIWINHYNIRNREHFKQKMLLGGAAVERNSKLRINEAGHRRYFLERYRKGVDMDQEFDRAVGNYCLWEIHKYKLCDIDNTVRDFFRNNPIEK